MFPSYLVAAETGRKKRMPHWQSDPADSARNRVVQGRGRMVGEERCWDPEHMDYIV